MNTTQVNNKNHQAGLDATAKFIASGGKVKVADNNYLTQEWIAPKPIKHFMPDNRK